jgi:cell division protein FtsL
MAQQINLYQARFRQDKQRFSAKTMLYTAVAVSFVLVSIAAYNGWKIFELQRQANAIEKQFLSAKQQKTDLERKITQGHADPALAEKVQRTENLLKNQQQLRALLQEDFFNGDLGYSRYLVALARQHIPGLWLTDISFSGAGRDLSLKGQTVVPELLPSYLQNLSKEALLQGLQFQVFQLNRLVNKEKAKTPDTLEFMVATSEAAGEKP